MTDALLGAFGDVARGTHYASVILLFGCFVFRLAVAERQPVGALGRGGGHQAEFEG